MSDLLDIADGVIAQAAPGEQVEAYVARGDETEIRVYGGDVEHFVSARSEGIGIRVIRGGRIWTTDSADHTDTERSPEFIGHGRRFDQARTTFTTGSKRAYRRAARR